MSSDLIARLNASPWYRLLGMSASSETPGNARLELPFSEQLTQLYGGVHGGVLLTLADCAVNLAVSSTFEHGERIATVNLSMSFLEPARPAALSAEGRLVRRGGKLGFAECVVRQGDRELARAAGVLRILQAGAAPSDAASR